MTDEIYSIKHMDQSERVVILPFYGEFGWLIMHHARYVHAHPAKSKVVCTSPNMECLFPSATDYFFDWKHPLHDELRVGDSGWHGPQRCQMNDDIIKDVCSRKYPGHNVIRPKYDCAQRMAALMKFKPNVAAELPAVDIAMSCRKRNFCIDQNWLHYAWLTEILRARGLAVGIVGSENTTADDLVADAFAWNHSKGATAGTVDLLSSCRLFVGTDTGVSHLAALMDIPQLIFRGKAVPVANDLTGIMMMANRTYFRRLPYQAWDCREWVLGAVVSCYTECSKSLAPHNPQ